MVDISKDNRLLPTNILFLTKTHVMPEQDITGTNCLDQFHFYHDKSTDKFESLTSECTNSVDVVSHHRMPRKLFFSFRKLTFMEAQLNILLLCHKIITNLAGFYGHARKFNFCQNVDLLLGVLISTHLTLPLKYCKWCQIMYRQWPNPSKFHGTTGPCFCSKRFIKKIEVKSVVRTLLFSDHDAVVLKLLLKSKASNIENAIAE